MVFRDLQNQLKSYIGNAEELERVSRDIISAQNDLQEDIDNLRDYVSSDSLNRTAFIFALNGTNYGQILIDNFIQDMSAIPQFQENIFVDHLVEVLTTNDPIVIQRAGNSFSVNIEMDRVAGTLEDYAAGILFARSVIEEDSPRQRKFNPITASNYWRWIFGNAGELYDYTLQLRFEEFADKAPYWHFIEYGVPQQLASDRGGFPTPPSSPAMGTVEKTRNFIFADFDNRFNENIDREERYTFDRIHSLRSELEDLDSLYELALQYILEAQDPRFTTALESIEQRLENVARGSRADISKVRSLANQLIEGEEIPGQIRVGGGARIRTIELQREIREALGID